MTPEQEQKLNDLLQWKRLMESSNTIPLNIDQAFRSRFAQGNGVTADSKSATSENQLVNEGGGSAYYVLKAPAGFVKVVIDGTTRYIPVYA